MQPAPAGTDDTLKIGRYTLSSRLLIGTGKYKSLDETVRAVEASGAHCVTVAVRRVSLTRKEGEPFLFDAIDPAEYLILPNTAGCYTADDAVRTARLARELLGTDLVKVEVIGDPKTLMPDVEGTLVAARTLVKEGFTVMPYFNDDVVTAKKLEDAGCACVMPLAAPIGSGLGIRNPVNLMLIREAVQVPMIVDAGVGTASDAAICMELGADGVLLNTAVAEARDPVGMATAMRLAVEAGRLAWRSGRMPRRLYASASSPLEGVIGRGIG